MFYFVKDISLIKRCDWSIGQCLQTSNKASAMLFTWLSKVYISNTNVLALRRKISKAIFQNSISK